MKENNEVPAKLHPNCIQTASKLHPNYITMMHFVPKLHWRHMKLQHANALLIQSLTGMQFQCSLDQPCITLMKFGSKLHHHNAVWM